MNMNRGEFYKRVLPIFRPECLRNKNAIVVGVGSGGGRVATELGRLGVGLILIDLPGEVLEEHNILRHELGYPSLGKLKTEELAKHIHRLNPETAIECISLDVVAHKREFRDIVEAWKPELVLACTDNEPSRHLLSEVGVQRHVCVIGAAAYTGGIGGEVWISRPGAPCYGCITAHQQKSDTRPKTQSTIDYTDLDLPELRSTCALNLDIAQIALIQTRVALNFLLNGQVDLLGLPEKANLIVFANRRLAGHFERPLQAETFHIPRQSDCLTCGNHSPEEIDLEAERILQNVKQR